MADYIRQPDYVSGAINHSEVSKEKLPWDIQIASGVSKALPNEIAQLSPWLSYIPYIGTALQVMGAADTGLTNVADIYSQGYNQGYSETERRKRAIGPAIQGYMGYGSSQSPGAYGSSGSKQKKNWADYVGLVGNLWQGRNNYGNMVNSGLDIYDAASGNAYGRDVWNTSNNQSQPEWEYWVRNIASMAGQYQNNYGKSTS